MRTCPTCQRSFPDETSFCPRDGTPLPAAPTLAETGMLGGISGRYRIIRPLGAGGMGSVFLAEQIAVGNRPVALKLLARKLLDDPEFLERFRNEAASTGRIRHLNVVTIYESGQADDGTPYIAMEYLEGKTLRQAIEKRGLLPVAEAAEVVSQAARGLNAAHKLGIIHRDLKPDNIFLTRGDEGALLVKVVDFGIAKLRESSTHTVTGSFLGTPAYMSFEQASGMRSDTLDARSDIYSLGIVAYEMLTGRAPFHADTSLAFVRKHLTEPPPPFRSIRPDLGLPSEIETAVMKALEKDRDRRYNSALDFARAFAEAARTGPIARTAWQEAGVDQPSMSVPGGPERAGAPRSPALGSLAGDLKSETARGQSDVAVATPPPTPLPTTPRTPVEPAITPSPTPAGDVGSELPGSISRRQPPASSHDYALGATSAKSRRELNREAHMRRRMEKIGRRIQSAGPFPQTDTPLWRRPLPVALLSILFLVVVIGLSHRTSQHTGAPPAPNVSGPGVNLSQNPIDAVTKLAETEKEKALEEAQKTKDEVLRSLGGSRTAEIPPPPNPPTQGSHPEMPPVTSLAPGPQSMEKATPAGSNARQQIQVVLLSPPPQAWEGSLKQDDLVGQQFVDGGLKLESSSVPQDILQSAPAGSIVTLELEIGSDGTVYKGRRVAGNRTLAKALVRAAKDGWKFAPPRVKGTPVRANATVTMRF